MLLRGCLKSTLDNLSDKLFGYFIKFTYNLYQIIISENFLNVFLDIGEGKVGDIR